MCLVIDAIEIENQLSDIMRLEELYRKSDSMVCLKPTDDRQENAAVEDILAEMTRSKLSMATAPRVKATAYLTKAALSLPGGDIVETGTYTGGTAAVIMKTIMAFDACDRKFWAFDSFQGLPERTVEDGVTFGATAGAGAYKTTMGQLKYNLMKLNAWNESIIKITKGWFNETCPKSPVQKISFLRLDGDLFVSTWDVLNAFYDKVIPGGYIYVDDFGSFEGCRNAVDLYRAKYKIYEPMRFIRENQAMGRLNFEAVWWKKRTVE